MPAEAPSLVARAGSQTACRTTRTIVLTAWPYLCSKIRSYFLSTAFVLSFSRTKVPELARAVK